LWGGATPSRGGIVLSTENLGGAPEIHRDDLYVVAGAGVITGALRREVEEVGLFYPVDPTSEAYSTLGGNVGEGAWGLRSLKYGTTRNYVLGLEMVTGDGKLISVGAKTVKNVAGYDLTRMVVGSEGTLAIVTSVTVRVLPLPPDEIVIAFGLPDAAVAADVARGIVAGDLNPTVVELIDRESLRGVADSPWRDVGALLMVGFDGTQARCDDQASRAKKVVKSECAGASSAEARRPHCGRILKVRRAVPAALLSSGRVAALETLELPPANLTRLARRLGKSSPQSGVRIALWGHAGQGVMHLALLCDDGSAGAAAAVQATASEVAGICEDLGGTAGSGRVGVTGAGRGVLKELKRIMDPKGILNPGKIDYDA
jgi:glycolate oxidase